MKKIIYVFVILVLLTGAALATKIGSTVTSSLDAEPGNTYIQANTGLNMGLDGTGQDLKMFADTIGDYVLWDMSADSLLFVGSILGLDDDSDLKFGSDNDFVFDSDTAATLDITPLATDESPIINIGYATAGVDVNLASATGGDNFLWDASDEALEGAGVNLTLDNDSHLKIGSTNVFDINSTTINQLYFGLVAAEDIGFDLATTNAVGLLSTTGVTTIDFNNIDLLTDVEKITFDGSVDVNSTLNGQIWFCLTGYEDFGLDLRTANAVGILSSTGTTTIDFNDVDRLTDIESITFDNGIDINNAAASQFGIADSGLEDIIIDLATTNTIGLFSTTGAVTLDFNDVDQLADVESITFDLGQSVNGATNEQLRIGDTETLTFDFGTENQAGIFSASGVTAIDLNAINLTDVGKLGFTTANITDINSPDTYKISMGSTAKEYLDFDFGTTNTVGISSKTGVTTIDFNSISLADVNLASTTSFDVTVIDANTLGATDPNTWTFAIGNGNDVNDTKAIRYWLTIKINGTTYYTPVFTGSPTQ